MLEYLFAHQLQPQFRYTNIWAENDLLIWDHLGTLHRAIGDYGPDEIRLIRRCQVMATKVFDPEFLRPTRDLAAAEPALGAGDSAVEAGYLGVGAMGQPMAHKLLDAGHGLRSLTSTRRRCGRCSNARRVAEKHQVSG
jgi:hypothetical protein